MSAQIGEIYGNFPRNTPKWMDTQKLSGYLPDLGEYPETFWVSALIFD